MHQFHVFGRPRSGFSWRRGGYFAIILAAAGIMQAAQPAEAQGFFGDLFGDPHQIFRQPRHYERMPQHRPAERRRHFDQTPAEPKAPKEAEGKKPAGPLYAVVSLADQHVSFYDANGLWERSVISTGVDGHPTPPGIFTILEKERWHRSNIYSGAPMPYMQRLTWTGVAMHEGVVTGRPASHGCVRLPGAFARQLFGITEIGERVLISPQDVTPKDIVNAHLPVPRMMTPPPGAENKIADVKRGKTVEAVALDKANAPENPAGEQKLLNPAQYAKALKAAAAANAKAAAEAKKAALVFVAGKPAEVRLAARNVAAAEDGVRNAKAELNVATAALEQASGDEAVKSAAEQKSAAETKLGDAEIRLLDAIRAKAAKDEALTAAQDAVREAESQAEEASASAKDAAAREGSISIFISRKTKHLYVRQATAHLFDMPITIRDPERPLGTHLFIATKPGADNASLRWVVLTPPAATEMRRHRHSSRRGHRIEPDEQVMSSKPFPETAAAALDRIEIPPEALQRIGERLWVGATLIVSDVEMSGEGRYPMDFMILSHTTVRED